MTEWSADWSDAADPAKQRKYRDNAPKHIRRRFVSAALADDVADQVGTGSLPIRTGDTVEVMRGDHAGMTGEVTDIDIEDEQVHIDGVERETVSGAETKIGIHPSNLRITALNLDDPQRIAKYDVDEDAQDAIAAEPGEEDDEASGQPQDEADGTAEDASEDTDTDYDAVVDGTVDEVKDRVRDEDLDIEQVLAAEQAGKDRVTLVDWLEDRVDGDTDE